MNHFAYLFILCIDLLTSARSGHSGYTRVIPLGKTSRFLHCRSVVWDFTVVHMQN